ncbi:MAG: hypothetical protein QOD72_12 [Acidimicrobiaceae bacterium]|nr:hypothetical protein [Acidimicrobiaceae bacterium]
MIAVTYGLELLRVHKGWAWFVIVGNGLAGAWALTAHWVHSLRNRALWWFTGAAEIAIFVQVILGVIMVSHEKLVAPKFHMFYGFVAVFAVALIYSYRFQLKSRLYLLYGFGGLFLMGLAIRAMLVAAP